MNVILLMLIIVQSELISHYTVAVTLVLALKINDLCTFKGVILNYEIDITQVQLFSFNLAHNRPLVATFDEDF